MEALLSFILSYWTFFIWGVVPLTVIGCGFLWFYAGRRIAEVILGAVIISIIYLIARKNERDRIEKIAKDIEDKREAAYEKIDNRNTGVSDVVDRLRNGSF